MNFWENIKDKKTLSVDIGSKHIRCVVSDGEEILKSYSFDSCGVEYGIISNEKAFRENIKNILGNIASDFNLIPKNVLLTISTMEQNSASLSVVTYTKRADGVITDLDIENIKNNARKKIDHLKDKIILHEIIIKNKVDGNIVLGEIKKYKGAKIESKVLFIYDDLHNYKILKKVFESLNVEIDKILSGPLVEAENILTEKEKRLGTAVLNIGHHISSVCVYERGVPLLSSCINYGGEFITSEIALLLRVDPDTAEDIKINLNLKDYSKRKCEEIIENSIYKFSEEVNLELSRIKRSGLLPGGIRIIGGSSGLNKIESYLKYDLKLPSINTFFDPKYSEMRGDLNYIKNYGASRYSDNTTEMSIYKDMLKNNYLKVHSFVNKFMP